MKPSYKPTFDSLEARDMPSGDGVSPLDGAAMAKVQEILSQQETSPELLNLRDRLSTVHARADALMDSRDILDTEIPLLLSRETEALSALPALQDRLTVADQTLREAQATVAALTAAQQGIEGDMAETDMLLRTLRDQAPVLEQAVKDAETAVQEAEKQLVTAQKEFDAAAKEWKRYEKLYNSWVKAGSPPYGQKKPKFIVAKETYDRETKELRAATLKRDVARKTRDDAVLARSANTQAQTDAQARKNDLNQQLTGINSDLTEAEDERVNAQTAYDAALQELREGTRGAEEATARLAQAREDLRRVTSELFAAMEESDDVSDMLRALEEDFRGSIDAIFARGGLESQESEPQRIEPQLSVVKIIGPNVLLHFASPMDESSVEIQGGGMLSSQKLLHEGGTFSGLASVTINGALESGQYTIRLISRQLGVLDTVNVSWSRGGRTLSLVDPADQWRPGLSVGAQEDEAGQYPGNIAEGILRELSHEGREALEADVAAVEFEKQSLLQSTTIDDRQIARIQALNLYEWSRLYISGTDMREKYFFVTYPYYRPENIQAYIDQQWRDRWGYSYNRGMVQDSILRTRSEMLRSFDEDLGYHEEAMAQVMQAAIDLFVGIKRGDPEAAPVRRIEDALASMARIRKVHELEFIGIRVPSRDQVTSAAKEVYDAKIDYFFQTQADAVAYREHQANVAQLLANNWERDENGQWVAVNGNPTLASLGRTIVAEREEFAEQTDLSRERRLQRAQRLVAGALNRLTGGRIQAVASAQSGHGYLERVAVDGQEVWRVALPESGFERFALDMEQAVVDGNGDERAIRGKLSDSLANETGSTLQSVIFVANAGMLDAGEIGGSVILDPKAAEQEVHFRQSQEWYDAATSVPGMTREDGSSRFLVRPDTPVGRMFLGLLQRADATSDPLDEPLARVVESVTGIGMDKIMSALRKESPEARAVALRSLFGEGQYGAIFAQHGANELPHIITVAADRPEYVNGSVRVRFDLVTGGKEISHARAYVLWGGTQLSQIALTPDIRNQMFVDIPVEDVVKDIAVARDVPVLIQIRLEMLLQDGLVISGKTEPVIIAWDGSTTNADLSGMKDVNDNFLTQEQKQFISQILDFGDLENLPEANRAILEYLIDNYISTDSDDQLQFLNNTELRGKIHGTGLMQCKKWLDEVVTRRATGIDLPANAEETTGKWVSDQYQVAEMSEDETLQTMLERGGALTGDVVQMYVEKEQSHFPHTMVIGKITSAGIWVFDTNYGQEQESFRLAGEGETATYIYENDTYRALTAAERENGTQATHVWQPDNTIRYHLLRFNGDLAFARAATVYRIKK